MNREVITTAATACLFDLNELHKSKSSTLKAAGRNKNTSFFVLMLASLC